MGILERKEREREARRTAILDAAERIFKLKGFTSSTMDDIARDAELAKGTVYLYYRSKEELQVGLVCRGMDILYDAFEEGMSGKTTAIERVLTMGGTYWKFAEENLFYFSMMHVVDLPHKSGQISEEALLTLHEKSNAIWGLLVATLDAAKAEGTVKPEVNSLVVAMMLWMNGTGMLRFHHKVRATADSTWAAKEEYNVCNVDWQAIYRLNGNMLLHEVVTARGMMYLQPVEWPTTMQTPQEVCAPLERSLSNAFNLAAFEEAELSYTFSESGL